MYFFWFSVTLVPYVTLSLQYGTIGPSPPLRMERSDSLTKGDGADRSDSDFSDLELDDVVAIKLRAKTPPWQKVEQSQW